MCRYGIQVPDKLWAGWSEELMKNVGSWQHLQGSGQLQAFLDTQAAGPHDGSASASSSSTNVAASAPVSLTNPIDSDLDDEFKSILETAAGGKVLAPYGARALLYAQHLPVSSAPPDEPPGSTAACSERLQLRFQRSCLPACIWHGCISCWGLLF